MQLNSSLLLITYHMMRIARSSPRGLPTQSSNLSVGVNQIKSDSLRCSNHCVSLAHSPLVHGTAAKTQKEEGDSTQASCISPTYCLPWLFSLLVVAVGQEPCHEERFAAAKTSDNNSRHCPRIKINSQSQYGKDVLYGRLTFS